MDTSESKGNHGSTLRMDPDDPELREVARILARMALRVIAMAEGSGHAKESGNGSKK